MAIQSKQFTYRTSIRWGGERRGQLAAEDAAKPPLEVATPPEFRGHAGYWTPEDLFVASLEACLMSTFLALAAREELELIAYESEAEGLLERGPSGQLMFTRVTLRPRVTVPADDDPDLAIAVLEMAEQSCIVSASVKTEIVLEPTVTTR